MIVHGDARRIPLPDKSVSCIITSPPYYGLRSYTGIEPSIWLGSEGCEHEWGDARSKRNRWGLDAGVSEKQKSNGGSTWEISHGDICNICGAERCCLGLERSVESYVAHLVEVFREVRRVLRPDGLLCLNLGDSFNSHPGQRTDHAKAGYKQQSNRGSCETASRCDDGYKAKDLMEIPSEVIRALRRDGWWLRSRNPWIKQNSMPSSVTDRPGSSVEYCFILSKRANYFWDAEAVKVSSVTGDPRRPYTSEGAWQMDGRSQDKRHGGQPRNGNDFTTRNRRDGDWVLESFQGLLCDEWGGPLALLVNPQPFSAEFCRACGRYYREGFSRLKARTVVKNERGEVVEIVDGSELYQHQAVSQSANGANSGARKLLRIPAGWDKGPGGHDQGSDCKGNYSHGERLVKGWRKEIQHQCECGEWEQWVSHYASFPEALVRPFVLAGASQYGVCAKCYAPYVRQLQISPMVIRRSNRRNNMGMNHANGIVSSGTMVKPREAQTTGWSASCTCETERIAPLILDPFGGSGTVAVVCQQLGLRCLSLDLSHDYSRLALDRLRDAELTDRDREMQELEERGQVRLFERNEICQVM